MNNGLGVKEIFYTGGAVAIILTGLQIYKASTDDAHVKAEPAKQSETLATEDKDYQKMPLSKKVEFELRGIGTEELTSSSNLQRILSYSFGECKWDMTHKDDNCNVNSLTSLDFDVTINDAFDCRYHLKKMQVNSKKGQYADCNVVLTIPSAKARDFAARAYGRR